ncbi:MAG: GNAT family N-acetyltransferase [Clostridia bacterium]|nr:GNAT family N-acetyltransferase [Clostridia bacterium]
MSYIDIYLADPVISSSLPFWKTETVTIPDFLKIVRDNEYRQNRNKYAAYSDEPYFKLIHRMQDLQKPILSNRFSIENISIADFSRHIGECYVDGGISEADLTEYINHPVYDSALWLAVKDSLTEKTVATGIAELDTRIGEGILEWIQVSPKYRRMGLGEFVVNELLYRMKGKADFVTVSGKVNNKTNPLALYEHCGFSEIVIWHVLTKK